jgi:nicotinamide-nucleotide amidase
MQAEIIAVGSEMLTPDRVDTNSLFVTERLNQLGIEVARKVIVGDVQSHVREAFRQALDRVEVVVASGGLGPTQDDLTREALAELLGRKLLPNDSVLAAMEARFRRLGRTMPEINKRQAMVPEGADVLENDRGTAPGLWLEFDGRVVVLLPGPPHELKGIFTERVEPRLSLFAKSAGGTRLFQRQLRTAGLTESELEQRIAPIYTSYPAVQTTILAVPGEIQVYLRLWSADVAPSEALLDEIVGRITMELGESIFSNDGQSLEEVVAHELAHHRATVAAAESCTGGLLAERLTRVPGSSAFFVGGVVCYSNNLKNAWVDVPAELLESKGAVSPEVAVALAERVRRRAGSTLGIGITGIAGPGGGSAEKPVGLVHIALADATSSRDRTMRFPGDRDRIRWFASQTALDMVRRYFLHAPQPRPPVSGAAQG